MKHVNMRVHFCREKVEDGTIVMVHCATEFQAADLFTKSLARVLHRRHSDYVMGYANYDK